MATKFKLDWRRVTGLGIGVALVYPWIAGVIPDIWTIPFINVTIGGAAAAGLTVVGVEWLLGMMGIKKV